MKKTCVTCGKEFQNYNSFVQCCSQTCGNIFKQANYEKKLEERIGSPVKDFLYDKYVTKFWDYEELCQYMHINTRTLMRYMRQFSIPIRSPSEVVRLQWIKNPDKAKSLKGIPKPSMRGDNNPSKRPEVRKQISLSKLGSKNPMFNKLGKAHHNWKGGKMTSRGKGWNSIRTQVLRRDNSTCQQCGDTERLEAHHIVTYRNKHFNTLPNLVTLCHNCHTQQMSHRL